MRSRTAVACLFLVACSTPTETLVDGPDSRVASSGPAVTAALPSNATPDTTLDVQVLGSGFDRGSKVTFERGGVPDPKLRVNSTRYLKSSELIANVTIAADALIDLYDVIVTTSKGKKGIGTELFAVEVPFETLSAPSEAILVRHVGPTGLIAGMISSPCHPGSAPALWDRAAQFVALPPPPGTCGGSTRQVNRAGVVVGAAYSGNVPLPVRWIPTAGGYVAELLPMLPNGSNPGAWSINELGWVGASELAAIWVEETGWRLLALPDGVTYCVGTEVGDGGHAVSRCNIAGQSRPVFWASPTAAPELLPLPSGATAATAWSLTRTGVAVGYALGTQYRAVRWTRSGTSWNVEFLPDLGYGSSAFRMNEAGHVAGSIYTKNGYQPALWMPDGTFLLLYSGSSGEATGVSEPDGGLVIGGYYLSSTRKTAVRWRP